MKDRNTILTEIINEMLENIIKTEISLKYSQMKAEKNPEIYEAHAVQFMNNIEAFTDQLEIAQGMLEEEEDG